MATKHERDIKRIVTALKPINDKCFKKAQRVHSIESRHKKDYTHGFLKGVVWGGSLTYEEYTGVRVCHINLLEYIAHDTYLSVNTPEDAIEMIPFVRGYIDGAKYILKRREIEP